MFERILIALVAALALALAALADERINQFDVDIDVRTNGDTVINETLKVTSEGSQIRRGILRNLPRYFDDDGARLPYDYKILEVTRNGSREPYATETDANALIVRIGSADILLENGQHIYEIAYRVRNQVRHFDGHDEIYWNATGNYWDFPIDTATATINLPPGARVTAFEAYTGRLGSTGKDFAHRASGDTHVFETTRVLQSGEGLSVALVPGITID